MSPLQVPGGIEIFVILFALVFNFAIIALVVLGIVYLYRRWGGGGADEAELDALRDRIAELETRVEELAEGGDGAGGGGTSDDGTSDDGR
ncbi:hypothetical protein [Halolamina rubra]|uniref:hypothetical protein n=1 Tax=Halolamina rubra TaxID=1380430 RepID=UPI00067907B7|nr:hypothetical protein [Halolamina rubra]